MLRKNEDPRLLTDELPERCGRAAPTQQLRQRACIGGDRQVRRPYANLLVPQPYRLRDVAGVGQGVASGSHFPLLVLAVCAKRPVR